MVFLAEASEKETECAACGEPGADRKYGGQMWHKKCLRKVKKQARKMF